MGLETIDIRDVDLAGGLVKETGYRIIALADSGAHTFGANLYMGGSKVATTALQSGVTGYFSRSDGITVELDGSAQSVSGVAQVKVNLSLKCYAVPGRFTLAIKVKDTSGANITVRLLEGYVYPVINDRVIESGVGESVSLAQVITALNGKLDKPAAEGVNGQVLISDGQGGVSWQSVESTQVAGSVKMWLPSDSGGSYSTGHLMLRVGTEGIANYITFVLED